MRLIENEDYESALKLFSEAIKSDPNNAELYLSRGIAYSKSNQKEQARNEIEKAISLNLDDSLRDIADKLLSQIALEEFGGYVDETTEIINSNENCEETLKNCDELLKLNPNNIDNLRKKEFCLNMMHKYDEAIDTCNKIIELDPDNKSAYNSKGTALHSLEKYEEAIICFKKVIELDPRDYDTYTWIGMCLEKLERYKEAIIFFDKALEINPEWKMALNKKVLSAEIIRKCF